MSTTDKLPVIMPVTIIGENYIPQCGQQVFWFQEGNMNNAPCPAIVNVTPTGHRAINITVFTVNGPMMKDAVKHIDEEASENDRRHNGGWAWNRERTGI